MGKYDELVERLKYCSDNTRDEYLHELAGRAATAITTLEAELEKLRPQVKVADDQWDAKCDELAAMKARGDRLAGFARHEGLCGLIGFYGECTCGLAQALTELRDQ